MYERYVFFVCYDVGLKIRIFFDIFMMKTALFCKANYWVGDTFVSAYNDKSFISPPIDIKHSGIHRIVTSFTTNIYAMGSSFD